MAFYRAKVLCYVDNSIRNVGDEFEYNGPKNTNLEPVGGSDVGDEDETSKPKRVAKPKAE